MFVDHLTQYWISSWPETAKVRGFCTCVTDGPTDKPSYRDAFLTDASNNCNKFNFEQFSRKKSKISIGTLG